MSKPTPKELELVQKTLERISDLEISGEFLEPKNIVRFVRARNGNLEMIEDMIRKNIAYYETQDPTALIQSSFPNSFETFFPMDIISLDDCGGPILHLPIGKWDASAVPPRKEDFLRYCLRVFEIVWALMRLQSKGKENIPQFSVICDLEGLGWRQLTTYDAIQSILHLFRIFEANYPDTLKRAVLVNAPSIFGMFWKLIRPIISEETHNKIIVLGSDKQTWKKGIEPFAQPHQFPEKYGGSLPDGQKLPLDDLGFYGYIFQNGNNQS